MYMYRDKNKGRFSGEKKKREKTSFFLTPMNAVYSLALVTLNNEIM